MRTIFKATTMAGAAPRVYGDVPTKADPAAIELPAEEFAPHAEPGQTLRAEATSCRFEYIQRTARFARRSRR